MGTDMHLMIEIAHRGGGWHTLGHHNDMYEAPREYPLFSLLADVRNKSGRGTQTLQPSITLADGTVIPEWVYDTDDGGHDPLTPISAPKGIPDDATEAWLEMIEFWRRKRSEPLILSHLTPAEIIAGDWDQTVYQYGYMPEEDYQKYLIDQQPPDMHIGGVGGEGLRVVNEVEYAQGVRGERETVVSLRWKKGVLRDLYPEFYESMSVFEQTRPPSSRMRLMLLFES